MELFKILGLVVIENKEANDALDETSDKAKKVKKNLGDAADSSEKSGGKFNAAMSKIGSAAVAAAKVVGAGMVAAGGAVAGLVTKSVQEYAEFEQLIGGAELMFGKAFDTVKKNAEEAYRTVQMSQNEYLTQVNGFATGLKTALGGNEQAAADLAHKIIKAEADIIAATGNTAENVQNAFNGIMKSNFTMLDNLQIGITPTKEGFQEVIDKVNEWNAANGNATKYQMDNLADMQAALVDYIDMVGMSGYAQEEAAKTITGSISSMKSAWKNMMSAMSDDNADFGKYVDQFVESASTVGDNLMPRIETALNGAVQLIGKLAPVIIGKIPELFSTLLPSVVGAAKGMASALGSALPGIASSLLPKIWEGAGNLITGLADFIQTNLPIVTDKAKDMVSGLGEKIKANLPVLISKGLDILMGLSQSILQNVPTLVATGMDLIKSLVMGIVASLPDLLAKAPEIITNFANTISRSIQTIFMKGLEIIWELIKGIVAAIPDLVRNIPQIIEAIFAVWNAINWTNLGKNLIKGITTGIKNMGASLKGTAKDLFGKLETLTANAFKAIGNFIMHPINTAKTLFSSSVSGIKNFAVSAFNALKGSVSSIFNGIKNAITNPIETAKNAVKTVIDAIKGFFNFKISWPKIPMPHFGISPSGWGIGDLLKGSIPKLSIDWYAKAMDKPMIMDTPTIFGYNPATGTLMGGGESGSEVVSGTTTLLNMIRAAVAAQNSGTEYYLQKLVEILADYFPQIMERMNDPIPAVFDTEKAADRLANPINKRLGVIAARKERGR